MAVVAAVALLLWGATLGSRSYYYHGRATFHAERARRWREIASRPTTLREFDLRCAAYDEGLARKYRRATWRPWLPVAPDPYAPGADPSLR